MSRILVVTHPEDLHATLLEEALRRKGVEPVVWMTSDFPFAGRETVDFRGDEPEIRVDAIGESRFDTVWSRRQEMLWGEPTVNEEDRGFTEAQCRLFRAGLLPCLGEGAFWVNPLESSWRARSKLFQHRAALEVGLRPPRTLYTNDPEAIRQWASEEGSIVYKAFFPGVWREGERQFANFTTRLEPDDLVADSQLQAVPGIYQELVPKRHELRVTLVGDRVFATKVRSQETVGGKLDWRLAWNELRLEACTLENRVENEVENDLATKCRRLLDRLGLVFGCFDFVVTPDGEAIFLEVNPMGQFAFVERLTGAPVIDAMAEMLLQGRKDFAWDEERVEVRLSDFLDIALERFERRRSRHLRRATVESFPPSRPRVA